MGLEFGDSVAPLSVHPIKKIQENFSVFVNGLVFGLAGGFWPTLILLLFLA
jgi:hypothetical protein